MSHIPVVYVETSVFIALIASEAGRVDSCRSALREGEAGSSSLRTSAFTIAEVVRAPGGDLPLSAETTIKDFFRHPWLHVLDVTPAVASKAREIARDHSLKPPDAVHVATALACGATRLLSYDLKILSVRLPGLAVVQPGGQGALPLIASAGARAKATSIQKK